MVSNIIKKFKESIDIIIFILLLLWVDAVLLFVIYSSLMLDKTVFVHSI